VIIPDIKRSYYQYKKHIKIGHFAPTLAQKILFICMFFILPFTIPFKYIYKKRLKYKLLVLPFSDKEPMRTLINRLNKKKNFKIVVKPKSYWIAPIKLYQDFFILLVKSPQWTICNLDFFGALSIKISQYYGYKCKYGIDRVLIFQEYSFYSSYLTYIIESDGGRLYNLMHGIPGKEASFFRFSKCFVWEEYFKNFYIHNGALKDQFMIVDSVYHTELKKQVEHLTGSKRYDIVYVLQGDEYSNKRYKELILDLLKFFQERYHRKVALKPHPIYRDKIATDSFVMLDGSIYDIFQSSELVISQFSTVLYDAKSIGKKVLAILPKDMQYLVGYLDDSQVAVDMDDAKEKILDLLKKEMQ